MKMLKIVLKKKNKIKIIKNKIIMMNGKMLMKMIVKMI